jgi:cytidine deaminase
LRKQTISFEMTVFDSFDDLSIEDQKLMNAAIASRKNAYAPYSNFLVGNNQENASYPSGLCAERVAVFYAGAKYPGVHIKAIAITATSEKYIVKEAAAPCGNCRQAISEYEQKQETPIPLMLMGETGEVIKCNSIGDILPLAFGKSFLG